MEPTERGYQADRDCREFNRIILRSWGEPNTPEEREYMELCRNDR